MLDPVAFTKPINMKQAPFTTNTYKGGTILKLEERLYFCKNKSK